MIVNRRVQVLGNGVRAGDLLWVDLSRPNAVIVDNHEDFQELLKRSWFRWGSYEVVAYKFTQDNQKMFCAYMRDSIKDQANGGWFSFTHNQFILTEQEFEDMLFFCAL